MNYQDFFLQNIEKIKNDNRYRRFQEVKKSISSFPVMENSNMQVWCSNDYLGMSVHPEVIKSLCATAEKRGVGSGGTRNISGTTSEIIELESNIAKFHKKESGLVFTSGYVSNLATISAITSIIPGIVIFSDQKNHASIISGIRINNVKKHIFNHNDTNHLEELIKIYPISTPKLIIFEGIYSMDSSTPNIQKIVEIAKKYNALTYVDEVHAVGLYGKSGRGISNLLNVDSEIDIIQGTFGKAFGVIGGYITASAEICDAIRLNGSSFIFTTSLPPGICAAISKSLEIVQSEAGDALRAKHFSTVKILKNGLKHRNIDYLSNPDIETHIIPVMIRNAAKAQQISRMLLEKFAIYAQHINYPTVPVGEERIRITTSPFHTAEMAEYLLNSLDFCIKNDPK